MTNCRTVKLLASGLMFLMSAIGPAMGQGATGRPTTTPRPPKRVTIASRPKAPVKRPVNSVAGTTWSWPGNRIEFLNGGKCVKKTVADPNNSAESDWLGLISHCLWTQEGDAVRATSLVGGWHLHGDFKGPSASGSYGEDQAGASNALKLILNREKTSGHLENPLVASLEGTTWLIQRGGELISYEFLGGDKCGVILPDGNADTCTWKQGGNYVAVRSKGSDPFYGEFIRNEMRGYFVDPGLLTVGAHGKKMPKRPH
jgi:hypothetical protein